MPPRVLFVDDDPAILATFRSIFRKRYDVGVAESPAAALDVLASSRPFDAIVSDIRMPGMSGLEFLHKVRGMYPGTARIALTGHADLDTATRAVNQGNVFKFLTKPCGQEELAAALDEAIAHGADLRSAADGSLQGLLAALHYRNLETRGHVERVGRLSAMLAREMGWSREQAELLRVGASLHDIGKIGIPDAVLLKPGRLTAAEYGVMQAHAGIGARMLGEAATPVLAMAQAIAQHHHERADGRGYPNGLAGKDIPECARIVAVADVYDALVSERVYRAPLSASRAIEVIRAGRARAFDAATADTFVRMAGRAGGLEDSLTR